MDEAYDQLAGDLVKFHKQFSVMDKKYEKDRAISGGVLAENKQMELDQLKRVYERLLSTVTAIAESLGKDIPLLEVGAALRELRCDSSDRRRSAKKKDPLESRCGTPRRRLREALRRETPWAWTEVPMEMWSRDCSTKISPTSSPWFR